MTDKFIREFMAHAWVFSMKYADLMTQSNNFKTEIASRTEKGTEKQANAGKI